MIICPRISDYIKKGIHIKSFLGKNNKDNALGEVLIDIAKDGGDVRDMKY